jgi:Predicted Zn-dependent protease (DUF2268)
MKKTLLVLINAHFYIAVIAQTNFQKTADSLYKAKNYKAAAENYKLAASNADFKRIKKGNDYNAACSYALDGNKEAAVAMLKTAIASGYDDKKNLLADTDLEILRKDSLLWKQLISLIKDPLPANTNPAKAVFYTEDIKHFWAAYEKAILDTANMQAIFKKEYFGKASAGMDDYMALKVKTINAFVKHIKERPKFYAALKNNTLKVDDYKKDFYNSFKNLKNWYPKAMFPDVYFVIGAFTSGGTVSAKGLLLGTNQMAKTPDIPVDELSLWEKNNFTNLAGIKNTVAHELIHFQQDSLKQDTTALCYAIAEGMADFIGELISGKNANERIHVWANGKEKQIWQRFTVDMYMDKYNNWIGNGDQETPDNPADQGYWIGYQICKAYFENAKNKKKAIYDMLHIQDYKQFLQDSKWEEKLAKMK